MMNIMPCLRSLFMLVGILALGACSTIRMVSDDTQGSVSASGVAAAGFTVPAPLLVQGQVINRRHTLGLDNFTDYVTVHVSFPDMAVGHVVGLRWKGAGEFNAPTQRITEVGTQVFRIPRAEVAKDDGRTAVLTASVGGNGLPSLIISDPLTVAVQTNLALPIPTPVVSGLNANGEYDLSQGDAQVVVDYPGMKVNDTIRLLWKGKQSHWSPVFKVQKVEPARLSITTTQMSDDKDSAAVVTASVGAGGPLLISQGVSVKVVGERSSLSAPVVTQATPGRLDLNDVADKVTVVFDDPGTVSGSTVRILVKGKAEHYTPIATATGPGPVTFQIDRSVFANDKDGDVLLTASRGGNGTPIVVSPPLTLTIVQPSGADILASLDARYNSVGACGNNRSAFYCNGVLVRSVDNGAFDPWDPSPNQTRIGATSFSYMRKDAVVRNTYRLAGFVFASLDDAQALGKPVQPLCIYPFDAATGVDQADTKGCGSRGIPSTSPTDLSTCAMTPTPATTLATWQAYTRTISNQSRQCSLSVQVPAQFELSLEARRNPTPNLNNSWNELMIEIWPVGAGQKLPIVAFFYKAGQAASLANAKTFQQKFRDKTQRWVPVISVNFSNQVAPFAYNPADQGVTP